MSRRSSPAHPLRPLVQQLEDLQRAGLTHLPRRQAAIAGAEIAAAAVDSVEAAGGRGAAMVAGADQDRPVAKRPPASADQEFSARVAALQVLQQEVAQCTRCAVLAAGRTRTVFGVGNPAARLCFLGEAPGADEDAQGVPFVGRAGQKLTDIITKGLGMSRDDVYILNVLKCRPPGNRTPLPDEVANCRGYFQRQLDIIRPEFVCCLGAVAAQALLETTAPIGRLRGRWYEYRGSAVMCTYHPSYLLRNPAARPQVWEDMKMLMQRMGIEPPARRASASG
jgi:uracil-DNA glycosylase family 4